jgi:hypothetical protein
LVSRLSGSSETMIEDRCGRRDAIEHIQRDGDAHARANLIAGRDVEPAFSWAFSIAYC